MQAADKIGKSADKLVTPSAQAGAKISLAAAKAKAPVETGALREGIILKGEKKKKAKKVYQVGMDPKKTATFVKMVNGKRYYYPAYQEYGYLRPDGSKEPGKHFLRDSLTEHNQEIEQAMLDKLIKTIDKALKKGK